MILNEEEKIDEDEDEDEKVFKHKAKMLAFPF